jgi:hypothetical protein
MDSHYENRITDLVKRLRPFLLSIATGAMNVNEWDNIILIVADGGGSSYYDPTEAGFTSAYGAASSGDVIYVPPATITGDHTIPAGVEIWGAGRDKTIFSGEITLSSDSVLNNLSVVRSVSVGGAITKGVIGTSSGTAYIFDCVVSVTNASSSEVRVVDQPAGGVTKIWESDLSAVVDGVTSTVGRYNQGSYAIYVTDDGEVVHRFCNIRATQDSTNQRNPFYDDIGSVFTPGANVSAGAFDVTAQAGIVVGGLTIGNWYSLENTSGPWDNGDVSDNLHYSWCISFDNGVTWDVIESLLSGSTRFLFVPLGCEHTEGVGANQAITYFKAAAGSVKIRVADGAGEFANNGGAMGWNLDNLAIELDATEAYASDIIDPLGATVPVPHLGDRSAYDVDDYDTKHASDIYNTIFQRHLPDSGNDGNVIYDDGDEWKSGTPGDAGLGGATVKVSANDTTPGYLNGKLVAGDGITLTEGDDGGDETLTIDAGGVVPAAGYWEPAVVAEGEEIMFTDDGDIAMIWVGG